MMNSIKTPKSVENSKRQVVNVRLLLITVFVLAIAGVGGYFWHQYSVSRISFVFIDKAKSLIAEAEKAQSEGDEDLAKKSLGEAVALIWQYQQVKPEDSEAAVLLAETFEGTKAGKKNLRRTADLYIKAVARTAGAEQDRLKAHVSEIFLNIGDFAKAAELSGGLLNREADGVATDLLPQASRVYAVAMLGKIQAGQQKPDDKLGDDFARAMSLNPDNAKLATTWASVYLDAELRELLSQAQIQEVADRQIGYADKADEIVDSMVQRNPQSASAFLERFLYRQSRGNEGAIQDLEKAGSLDPESADVNLQFGLYYRNSFLKMRSQAVVAPEDMANLPDLNRAQSYFEKCLEVQPGTFAAIVYLGEVFQFKGESSQAVELWINALENVGKLNLAPLAVAGLRDRVVATLIDIGRTGDAEGYLEDLRQQIDKIASRAESPEVLAALILSREYLTGALLFKQGEYGRAIKTLEEALDDQSNLTRKDVRTLSIIRLLGRIYLKLEMPSRAANVYETATKIDESNRELRAELSRMRTNARQFEMARNAFVPLIRSSTSPREWLQMARLSYQLELSKRPSLRDWRNFDIEMKRARQLDQENPSSKPWEYDVLDLQVEQAKVSAAANAKNVDNELVQEYREQAKQRITKLEKQVGTDPDLVKQLVMAHHRAGNSEDVQRLLVKYETMVGDVADKYVFRAGLLVSKNEKEKAVELLNQGLAVVGEQEKAKIQVGLVSLSLGLGDVDQAFDLLEEMVGTYNDRPEILVWLAELNVQFSDRISPEPAKWEAGLVKIEGDAGPFQLYFGAARLLKQVSESTDAKKHIELLRNATDLSQEVIRMRGDWSAGYALRAQLQKRLSEATEQLASDAGNPRPVLADEQIAVARRYYWRAIDLGERRPSTLLRLAEIEPDPARRLKLFEMMDSDMVAGNESLADLRMSLFVNANDLENAKKVAIRSTEIRSQDSASWLSLAQIQSMSDSHSEAMESVDKAILLAQESESKLTNLKRVFAVSLGASQYTTVEDVREKWVNKAREVMAQIVELSPEKGRVLSQAQMQAALGEENAGENFLRAEQKDPNNIDTLQYCLAYFASRNFVAEKKSLDEAIRIATRLVVLRNGRAQDRKNLADLLAKRGESDDWDRISDLLDVAELDAMDSAEIQRVKAVHLLNNRSISNSERINNLGQALAIASSGETTSDLILAAQIHREWAALLETQDLKSQRLEQAALLFQRASKASDIRIGQLGLITEYYIEQEMWDQANETIQVLKAQLGNELLDRVPVVALEAIYEFKRGNVDPKTTVEKVRKYAAEVELASQRVANSYRAQLFQKIALIFDSIESNEESVIWRTKAVNFDPRFRLALVQKLARNGKKSEAIRQCILGYQESNSPGFVIAITDALISGENTKEQFAQVEPVFASSLLKYPENVNLMIAIGNVRLAAQNDPEKAIELYEKAFQKQPANLLLLNNLATAYAENPSTLPQALHYVDLAIENFGKHSGLIDTKAVILMMQGKLDPAKTLLADIVHERSDSRYWWHLAEVNWLLFDQTKDKRFLQEAEEKFGKALKLGLQNQILTPSEKKRLDKLRDDLGQPEVSFQRSKLLPRFPITFRPTICSWVA